MIPFIYSEKMHSQYHITKPTDYYHIINALRFADTVLRTVCDLASFVIFKSLCTVR